MTDKNMGHPTSESMQPQASHQGSNSAPFKPFNFEELNEAALPYLTEILEGLLDLDIKLEGKEILMLNPHRRDDDFGSFSISSETGMWADFADGGGDKAAGGDVTSLVAFIKRTTQGKAARLLQRYLTQIESQAARPPGTASALLALPAPSAKPSSVPMLATVEHAEEPASSKVSASHRSVAKPGEGVPPPGGFKPEFGKPKITYWYNDPSGRPIAVIHRFENAAGKSFAPSTLVRSPEGALEWNGKAPPIPRPLYNLDLLAAKPAAPVIICEGEKAADAAAQLLPDWVATTSMNGAKSPQNSDFSPLAGRQLTVWPDNDGPGHAFAEHVVDLVQASAPAADIAVLNPVSFAAGKDHAGNPMLVPGFESPKGWDAADARSAGWTPEHARQLLAQPGALRRVDSPETRPVEAIDLQHLSGIPTESRPGNPSATSAKKKKPPKDDEEPPLVVAQRFIEAHFGGRMLHDGSGFRSYRDGFWPQLHQAVDLERKLVEFLGISARPRQVKELITLITMAYARSPEDMARPQQLVCVLNGTLDPRTGELHPHNPDYHLSNQLKIKWEPEAQCPLWLQTLDEIFVYDADKALKIQLLQEFIGYCLVADTTMHKFLWMVGGGGNGKSLILAMIEHVIGRENVCHAQLDRIQDPNVRAELQGKLLNISAEMSAESTVSDGYLKQIVSGDTVEAERKFQAPFSFKPYARLIGATNALPRLLDDSEGFFRRAVVVTFTRQFTGSEQDRTREERLRAELSGILVWAVAGLQRLLARERFDIPPSSLEALDRYRVESNPVRQFSEECLTPSRDPSQWVKAQPLYKAYKQWCIERGYRAVASAKFKNQLVELGFVQQRDNVGRFWQLEYSCEYDGYDLLRTTSSSPAEVSPLASKYTA